MRGRQLGGLIAASALVTLDGTATTIALPAIGQDLSASVTRLQWVSSAPLVILAAMLLPAGAIADRFGRVRVIRTGLAVFAAGAVACILAWSDLALIGARFLQGAGSALVLPAALATLRAAYTNNAERAQIFGMWAAWTGVAAAVGPLLAGALVDLVSWRAVFVPSVVAGGVTILLLEREVAGGGATRRTPIPAAAATALIVLFGAAAYLLTVVAGMELDLPHVIVPAALACIAAAVLVRDRHRSELFPRELMRARNCLPANAATFALYFGMFGLSFLVALYTQQVLGYSALRAGLALLPVSVMLFLAGVFGQLAARIGVRPLIVTGALTAAGGIYWIAAGPQPLAFWTRLIPGTAAFGLGISLAVSALTHAAVAAVPETCAGAASGLNHAVVRAAGLVAIALLGSIAAPGISDAISPEGFGRAMLICAAVVGGGGVAGSLLLRDEEPGGLANDPPRPHRT